jgi:hypothetical protein
MGTLNHPKLQTDILHNMLAFGELDFDADNLTR